MFLVLSRFCDVLFVGSGYFQHLPVGSDTQWSTDGAEIDERLQLLSCTDLTQQWHLAQHDEIKLNPWCWSTWKISVHPDTCKNAPTNPNVKLSERKQLPHFGEGLQHLMIENVRGKHWGLQLTAHELANTLLGENTLANAQKETGGGHKGSRGLHELN